MNVWTIRIILFTVCFAFSMASSGCAEEEPATNSPEDTEGTDAIEPETTPEATPELNFEETVEEAVASEDKIITEEEGTR